MRRFFFFIFIISLSVANSHGIALCPEQTTINKRIIQYVNQHVDQKIGRGECWDLAAAALNSAGAVWNQGQIFGKKINYQAGECLSPGDIIQFENVNLSYEKNNSQYTESYIHHTAIIHAIGTNGALMIAQQNTSDHGRRVSLDSFNFNHVKSGSIFIFRAQQK
jgi:hypothetical protein